MNARKAALPIAAAGALALALVPALPAAAATITWTQAGDSWWSTATWSGGVPASGDFVVFDGGPRSTYDLGGTVVFEGLSFMSSHLVANNGGVIGTASSGVEVAPGFDARIELDMLASGDQTWTVAEGASLTLPTVIRTDGAGTLTLDVDGTVVLSGNLDALGTGSVVKTGSGTVERSGGAGGGIGGGGLDVQEGVFELVGASIGGTAFQVTGGTLAGDGVMNALTLTGGVLAPGAGAGAAVGTLTTGNATLSGGTYVATIDAAAAPANDYLYAPGTTLAFANTTLEIDTVAAPAVGTEFEIAGTNLSGVIEPSSRFLSPAGDVLEHDDEFVTGGHVYRIGYAFVPGGVVTVEYVGLAPMPPAPPAPALAVTGFAGDAAAITGGVALLLGSALVLLVARRRRES